MSVYIDIKKHLSSFDLDVHIEAGNERIGLLGASGCGKSLTMRCVAGVEHPDEGCIMVNDRVYYDSKRGIDLTPQERKTALLFQNYQLFPNMSVEENVQAGMDKKLSKAARHEAALKALHIFGMQGFANRFPGRLSGGQQQRVALARMIAAQPDIFMFDEPFSALDSFLKSSLEQSLLDMLECVNSTVLYVSHDIDEAFRFCHKICVIDHGHVAEFGPTQKIVSDPETLAAVKLSGCKNISAARRIGDYMVEATDWGMKFRTKREVPGNISYIGIRAFYIHPCAPDKLDGINTYTMQVIRTSDSRFERTVILQSPTGTHIQWKVDKLQTAPENLPAEGQQVVLHFDAEKLYLVRS
ncbi:MAG: ATP-binding cassette domain-containing protein [Coriobacteriales bacterium]|nr:ATP-binding cassette domain-containing protein [Coriobacteriales bacterium]